MIAAPVKVSWIQERFPQVVGVMVAGGFALTVGELLLMNHTEKAQLIGVAMSGVGMVAALLGVVTPHRFRKLLLALLIVVAGSGLFGVFEHFEEAQEHREKAQKAVAAALARGEEPDPKAKKQDPPPVAPLSVTGLAMLGGLGLLARRN